jgi:hypothetical protein
MTRFFVSALALVGAMASTEAFARDASASVSAF